MREEETVKQYADRIMAVVNSIRLLGEHFDEAGIVEKVLSTFPERYEPKISSLEDSRDLVSIFLTELINTFYAQEQRRASRAEDHQEGAFQAKTREASSINAHKGKKFWKNRPQPDTARSNDQPCRYCKRAGHPEDRCWFRPDAQPKVEAQIAEDSSDHEEQVFTMSCSAAEKKCSKGWLLDSGRTNHMSPDASLFKTLDRSCKTKVKVGNGQFIKAEGKGEVLIRTPTGNKVISNVLLVPEIDRNLLSIAQLLEKGYSVVFKDKQCQIVDPSGSSLMTVTMSDKCFEVHWPNDSKSAYITSTDDSELLHQRLGHANFRSMARMAREGLAEKFTNSVEHDDVCEVCQMRK
ncbi:uncharacterized protein [Gossypium hirsutum]|uniref:GAG-pre-integrase domain-containing protein n=1 Tax=Gossypium hirsutum TaxID=3635 RepID=A0A1U8KP59_GOSHI|nr:uncharacterized protein LOC107919280 [Gossypium hirsutum]